MQSFKNFNIKFLKKEHALFLALIISLSCHILWFSLISVKPPAVGQHPIKLSNVSFLGPLLKAGSFEVKVRPKERSLLEKRLEGRVGNLLESVIHRSKTDITRKQPLPGKELFIRTDRMAAGSLPDILAVSKREPDSTVSFK